MQLRYIFAATGVAVASFLPVHAQTITEPTGVANDQRPFVTAPLTGLLANEGGLLPGQPIARLSSILTRGSTSPSDFADMVQVNARANATMTRVTGNSVAVYVFDQSFNPIAAIQSTGSGPFTLNFGDFTAFSGGIVNIAFAAAGSLPLNADGNSIFSNGPSNTLLTSFLNPGPAVSFSNSVGTTPITVNFDVTGMSTIPAIPSPTAASMMSVIGVGALARRRRRR